MLVLPGYQSTTKSNIDDLCVELRKITIGNKIYLAKGMNGQHIEPSTGLSVHDCHVPPVEPYMAGTADDHSKCIIFADGLAFSKGKLKTKAMLVGSSNLSYNTYIKSPAPKGELDVLLIGEAAISENSRSFIRFADAVRSDYAIGNSQMLVFSRSIDNGYSDQNIFASYINGVDLADIFKPTNS